MQREIDIRPLAARDSLEALARLLNRAYAPLAARGMDFTEATQDAQETALRAAQGQCLVASCDGELVGTATVAGPYSEASAPWTAAAPWFHAPDTAHLHQFAVEPARQRQGIGRRLVLACEAWARERGYRAMVLDTAHAAQEMRQLYRSLGYAEVAEVQWPQRQHLSVVMHRSWARSPLRQHLQTLAQYNVWATDRLLASHVATLTEADYRRDAGLFFKSVHGTLNHLLLTEHLLWYPRFARAESPSLRLDQEVETDRQALATRLLAGAQCWAPLIDSWDDARFDGRLEYTSTQGLRRSLPFALALSHVFNHGTHHRGQITAALTAQGHACPELDMPWMLQALASHEPAGPHQVADTAGRSSREHP